MRKKRGVERRAPKDRGAVADLIRRSLELPVEVFEGLPELSLTGNREAYIEHCQGVLEYNEEVVRVRAGKLTLKFCGRGLSLRSMTDDSMTVEGFFTSVEFI